MKKKVFLALTAALLITLFCALLGGCSLKRSKMDFIGGIGKENADITDKLPDDSAFVPAATVDVPDSTVQEPEPSEKPTEPVEESGGKILKTKYFNIVMPNSWVGRYYAELPETSGYLDYDRKTFHYEVRLYEKEGYTRGGGQGYLLDIILTSDPNFNAFANGRKLGEMVSDSQYYFFVRYPTDVRFDMDTQKAYKEMENDISKLFEGIYSDTYSITLYEFGYEEEPQGNYGDFILPDSSDRLLTEADIEVLMNNTYRESPSGNYVQDAINEIYARNGYVFQNEKIYNYYARQDWYRPDSNFSLDKFSQIEKANIALLQQYL